MSSWIPWRVDEPRALARYVLPDAIGGYLHLAGPSGDSPVQRLAAVYAAVATAGIRYAYESPADQADTQQIRSPAEVLWAPRHATCLDLALVLAGACMKAGLDPLIMLIERTDGAAGRHALVGVWVQDPPEHVQDELDSGAEVWDSMPGWLAGLVRRVPDDAGRPLVVLDPVGVSAGLPSSPARGLAVPFGQAATNGADRLTEDGWSLTASVNLVRAWRERETYQSAARPAVSPLREPYLEPRPEVGPLQLLRADYQMVQFQPRDELTVLRHWCAQAAASRQLGLAVIDGTGGSGKTRLALELARRLQDQGWYAGLLLHGIEGSSWVQSVDWLASVVSPTLVIVDYADARVGDVKALLRALADRAGPAVVVLTARTVEGEWLTELQGFLQRDGQVLTQRRFELPPEHPDSIAIFQRAVTAFATGHRKASQSPDPDADTAITVPERWTTLDYVLLGWLIARTDGKPPSTRRELYGTVLDHEQRYWADVYRDLTRTTASPFVLRSAAACLTLMAPAPEQAGRALQCVEDLEHDGQWRENIRRTFAECLYAGPGEALALRPDPVADQLTADVLSSDTGLLDRCLASLDDDRLLVALANLNRASSTAPQTVTTLLTGWLRCHPGQWHLILAVAAAQAGSALTALEALASENPSVLPIADLAEVIPFGHIVLTRLGLAADTQRLRELRAAPTADPSDLAVLLERVSNRQADIGERDGALATSTEAVQINRALAQASPAAHLPDLARALNTLANRQAGTGDRDGALATSTEAVQINRALAQASPAAHLPNLATALNNLANQQAETGDRDAALATSTEAVQINRALAQASPAAHLPNLAAALNNLALWQAETGDRDGALATSTEAVQLRRALAQASPAAHLPDLAAALNNLANRQAETGDRDGALATSTEAVTHYRVLALASPAAHRPDLATALNNLANQQAETGDRDAALATSTEAVQINRALAQASPAAHLPDLAMTLSNLAAHQAGTGDGDAALATITEAVIHYRALALASPAAHRPDLATALNNLAVWQAETGDRDAALATSTEAVTHYRVLAQASPAAHRPNLATALNNLANRQAETGDRDAALATSTEAVTHYRVLAQASPAAHLRDLAITLSNLAARQAETGDWNAALATSTEAVQIRRALAQASPAAHLPDLAMALSNLALWQAETGDRDAALATSTEAVQINRALAQASPAAHLPNLATALNNLANQQAGTGGHDAALATSTEAVTHFRALAQASPAAHLPSLAGALNTLANRQADTGDRDAALATSTEAVQINRALAQASPAAHLPDLATALNNLANQQAETGDRDAALATSTEAVQLYRALAQASPAAHLPSLAAALNNLANQQAETGDRDAALATSTEAVQLRRALAQASPAAHLPSLAAALNNLANQQAETGDRDAALATSTEAVQLYRALAQASPAAHLPNLATALNNLTRPSGHRPATVNDTPWQQAIAAFNNPVHRAELRAYYAQALANSGRFDAADQLASAAVEAESVVTATLGRTRLAIRRIATTLGKNDSRLPDWATRPVPDADIDLINTWTAQRDWPAIATFLTGHASSLQDSNFRASFAVLAELYPGNPALASLQALLAEMDSRGLEAMLANGRAAHAGAELLRAWIATPTWSESAFFLRQHQDELTSPQIRQLLKNNRDNKTALQHLAIVDLATTRPVDEVYQIITDPAIARECALDLIEAGDLTQLALVLTAAPTTAAEGISGAFIQTVIALAGGDSDTARQIAEQIARHGNPSQREALAIRLCAFATHQPDQTPALEIADIITPGHR